MIDAIWAVLPARIRRDCVLLINLPIYLYGNDKKIHYQ